MVLAIAASQLAACQTTGSSTTNGTNSFANRVAAAKDQAAIKSGATTASLVALKNKYHRNSNKPANALAYAKGLRQAGNLKSASLILMPFTKSDEPYSGVKTEMSMIELGLSNYNSAENYAKAAVLQDPKDYQAYQNLGIALDAKEMHVEAERAFRKGLENWQGDPTTIMNNLALNLATQGFVDEAIEILEQAKALSPDRIEIERNLRIIRTLNER